MAASVAVTKILEGLGTLADYAKSILVNNPVSTAAMVLVSSALAVGGLSLTDSTQWVNSSDGPCLWLYIDVLIVCITVAVVAPCIEFLVGIISWFCDSGPNSTALVISSQSEGEPEYPDKDVHFDRFKVIFAHLIKVIGSTFILLTIVHGTIMNYLPVTPPTNTSNGGNMVPNQSVPVFCGLMSARDYNYILFFSFGTLAAIFTGLRAALVTKSRKLGGGDGGGGGGGGGNTYTGGGGQSRNASHSGSEDSKELEEVVKLPKIKE